MPRAIPATLMRGGTSKGVYFDASDLPSDATTRDRVLLAVMGSPDLRQIDGLGGAHPLTSKVAAISPSTRPDSDVDYLFLQVAVDRADVSSAQNCGNILAGVGPWAIEHGLVEAHGPVTAVRIHMVNTGGIAVAHVRTPEGGSSMAAMRASTACRARLRRFRSIFSALPARAAARCCRPATRWMWSRVSRRLASTTACP